MSQTHPTLELDFEGVSKPKRSPVVRAGRRLPADPPVELVRTPWMDHNHRARRKRKRSPVRRTPSSRWRGFLSGVLVTSFVWWAVSNTNVLEWLFALLPFHR